MVFSLLSLRAPSPPVITSPFPPCHCKPLSPCHCEHHEVVRSNLSFWVPHSRTHCFWAPEIATSPKIRAPRNDVGGSVRTLGVVIANPFPPCHCKPFSSLSLRTPRSGAKQSLFLGPSFPYVLPPGTRDCHVAQNTGSSQ